MDNYTVVMMYQRSSQIFSTLILIASVFFSLLFVPLVGAQNLDGVLAIEWNHDGSSVAFGYMDGTVEIQDLITGDELILQAHLNLAMGLSWSPDDSRLVTGGGSTEVRVWDTMTGEIVGEIEEGRDNAVIRWSPDSTMIAVFPFEDQMFFIDVDLMIDRYTLRNFTLNPEDRTGTVFDMVWLPDSMALIVGDTSGELLLKSQSYVTQITTDTYPTFAAGPRIQNIVLSPNGNIVVNGFADGRIYAWDRQTFAQAFSLNANDYDGVNFRQDDVLSIGFSIDGSTMTAVSGDGTVRTWDTTTLAVVNERQLPAPVQAAAISPDGTQIAYATQGVQDIQIVPTIPSTNQSPLANASADQTVQDADGSGSESVMLDGSGQ